jgi:cytochrome c556
MLHGGAEIPRDNGICDPTLAGGNARPAGDIDGRCEDASNELMKKVVGKNWKPIKAYAKKGEGTPAAVAAHAAKISEAAGKITALFPKGTGRGDFSDKTTRALPAIWKDWAGFEKATKALADESAKLAAIAKSGDKDAIVKQIGTTGKLGCGGCHKPFRGAKVK